MKRRDLIRPWWLLPPARVHAAWWIPFLAAMLWLDYSSGLGNQFPVVYVIPVLLAGWYSGRLASVAIAVAVPVVHVALLAFWWRPDHLAVLIAQTAFRGALITVMGLWFARLGDYERALDRYA